MDMARGFTVVKHTPVLAGVNGTDPFCQFDKFLDDIKATGFAGCKISLPSALMVLPRQLRRNRMGYGLEVEMIRLAHERFAHYALRF